jgi:hypothetical protein
MLGAAFFWGLFAGVLTAIFEGPSKSYEYQLEAVEGDVVTMIVQIKSALRGECVSVSVRVSSHVTMTKRAMYFCEPVGV